MKIGEIMTRNVISVTVPGSRNDALEILVRHPISGIPVVKEGTKHLVGIVTRRDIFLKPDETQLFRVMKRPVIQCYEEDTVSMAARMMVRHRIHRLPVVNSDEELVGIVTPMDILEHIERLNVEAVAGDVMSVREVYPVWVKTPSHVVLSNMVSTRKNASPVIDDELKVVGIVTDRDIYQHSTVNERVLPSELIVDTDEDDWSWGGLRNVMRLYYEIGEANIPQDPVERFMSSPSYTVYRTEPVTNAAHLMHEKRFSQLPVIHSNGSLEGMLTDLDILSVLAR